MAKQQLTVQSTTAEDSFCFTMSNSSAGYQRTSLHCYCKGFPSIAALARVWLGKSPSNAFQERVFSTGSFVVSYLRIHNDSERA
ncbi:hypothetical protein PF011_g23200 [Phytophthora fragariae]|uniref:HAT C-terminal dimerisation domain-containing protein n=1 Tax=Phytophthora fragariae TaxID=53985 RepID=A0A6A3I6C5_9STRA|nr:hypothetical protein PF011_g23200 [Phytophthora fragariae]